MPHIIVKWYAGRTRDHKKALADKITQDVVDISGCSPDAVSVAFEDVEPDNWAEAVFRTDILEDNGTLFKKPGYNPFGDEKDAPGQQAPQDLMAYVRGAAEQAAKEDTSGMFNPMSWLDLELEDNPQKFDSFFDAPWDNLSDEHKAERVMAIRRVL